jgi:hypothetical protein
MAATANQWIEAMLGDAPDDVDEQRKRSSDAASP